MEKQAMNIEMAEKEFERILKAARLNWDRYLKRNGQDAIDEREEIVNAIIDGEVSVNEEGFPTVHPYTDEDAVKKLTFHRRLVGGDMRIIGKSQNDEQQFYAVTGRYFKVAPALIESLEIGDIALIQMLWLMFRRR